ncbi:proline racemase family protein [Nonomuraea longicatena]|uniref:Proline racemase family protein n=1 Tax=Nonomuraea longicatena TaxID=83682 RepID=A0ABP3ZDS8_9ACTN
MIRTVDYHTGGEPFRIAVDGVPEIPGATVAERRRNTGHVDHLRRLLCHEPRGHADMYGCFLVPPDDAGADLGVLFWHKDGYSTACGHGTIALGVHAVQEGLVPVTGAVTPVVVDVPSGRVTALVRCEEGRVVSVAFRNVASYVVARDVPVEAVTGDAPGDSTGAAPGDVTVDLAYGGALYASVPASAFGLTVEPEHLPAFVAAGRRVKAALSGHPDLYGVIFHEEVGGPLHQRNVTVFADGEVDRSPCGSGTCARLALLAESHGDGLVLTHDSVVGSRFVARVVARTEQGIVPEVEGMAYRTGRHVFDLDPADPVGHGFTLR